jgi:hypothetical protein
VYPHPLPSGSSWCKYLSKFQGCKGISIKRHVRTFDRFVDHFDALSEDVLMKLFLTSLEGDACICYRELHAGSIDSL